ncbi:amidohydrolase family protein [Gammaproteobacteria bacterium]|jgi:predicted amidohydrolase YtcJ|nr:amidohydrolase family protein [Gammaproteobacteria bacterium]
MSALHRTFSKWIAVATIAGYCGLVGGIALAASSPFAETVILNGKVITLDSDEIDDITFAEAIAIRGNEIIAVGSNDEVRALMADWTEVIDAGGRTVIPGLIDTHNHLYENTLQAFPWVLKAIPELVQVQIKADTPEEMVSVVEAALRARVTQVPAGQWIQVSLNPAQVAVQTFGDMLNMQLLDSIAPDNPVLVRTRGGAIYNKLGIDSIAERYRNPIPADFWIDESRGWSGDYTDGPRCVRGDIMVPQANRVNDYIQAYHEVMQLNAQTGVTTHKTHLQCEGGFNASVHLDRNDLMPIRLAWGHRWMQPFNPRITETYWRIGDWVGYGSDMMWSIGSSAGALDGGGVAWCTSIPADDNIKRRELCPTMESSPPNVRRLSHLQVLAELAAAGRQTGIPGWHVAGDGAIQAYLDTLFAAGIPMERMKTLRLQVDHCHSVTQEQIEMAARLNMAFSCDATRVPSQVIEEDYGEEYLTMNAPVASMLKAGARALVSEFGSQSEIRHSPFEDGVMWMTRKIDGKNFGVPEEAVPDRLTLLLMMSRWGAYALWRENEIGSIEAGKWADILILNGDYMAGEVEDLDELRPIMTMIGGKVVFEDTDLRDNQLRFNTDTAEWEVARNTPTDLWRWESVPPVIPAY